MFGDLITKTIAILTNIWPLSLNIVKGRKIKAAQNSHISQFICNKWFHM